GVLRTALHRERQALGGLAVLNHAVDPGAEVVESGVLDGGIAQLSVASMEEQRVRRGLADAGPQLSQSARPSAGGPHQVDDGAQLVAGSGAHAGRCGPWSSIERRYSMTKSRARSRQPRPKASPSARPAAASTMRPIAITNCAARPSCSSATSTAK